MLKYMRCGIWLFFFFSSRRRHTRWPRDWSSDVCSSDLVRAGGLDMEWLGLFCETLADPGEPFPIGYPTREQSAVLSPEGPACVPQDHLERVLTEHLGALPAAEIRTAVEVVGVDDDQVARRDAGTGGTGTVRARFVIGADG